MTYAQALRLLHQGRSPLAEWGLSEAECNYHRAMLGLAIDPPRVQKAKRRPGEPGY